MSLTRRGFLKAAGAAAAVTTAAGGAASYGTWLKPAKALAQGTGEKTAYTFHQWHCGGNCSLKCTVRNPTTGLARRSSTPFA